MANLARMAQADLKRVEKAARAKVRADADLRTAILLARESGETHADIGRAAGLSAERVRQIAAESGSRG